MQANVTRVLPDNRVSTSTNWQALLWLIIGIGIALRLYHFFENRSLWLDELALGINILKLSFWELATQVFEYEQRAPIGYLWATKLSVLAFGQKEMALRLFSLLCGIGSLFVFLPVANHFLRPVGAVVAMGVLALSSPIVYHAVEAKQYSTELFVTIVALYAYIRYQQQYHLGPLVQWGLSGALLVWFSFTSIFILAGMAVGSSLYHILKREWKLFAYQLLPFGLWLFSFAINFFLFTYKHTGSEWLIIYFRNREGFMPLPPFSAADILWFFKSAYTLLEFPLGIMWNFNELANPVLRVLLKMPIPLFLFWAVGLASFFRRDKKTLLVLSFPTLLTLIASGLEQYPFYERLIFFLAPLFILPIARGCTVVVGLFPTTRWRYALPMLVLVAPLFISIEQIVEPELFGGYKKAHNQEVFRYISSHRKPGDVVYVYWNEVLAYRYYRQAYQLPFQAIQGHDVRFASRGITDYFRKLQPDFAAFAGKKRVWIVYNKDVKENFGDVEGKPKWYYTEHGNQKFYQRMKALGKQVDAYRSREVSAHLFDFSVPAGK